MARPRAFDPGEVLDAAVEVFMQGGYANAPIKALEARTGLASGSIYNAYGDKRGLYRAALGHYVDTGFARLVEAHGLSSGGLGALRALLLDVLERAACERRGCLLTSALVEAGGAPDLAPAEIARGFEALRSAFAAAIAHDLPAGQVALRAERLVTLYQGLCVRLRAGHDRAVLEAVVEAEMDDLRRAARPAG